MADMTTSTKGLCRMPVFLARDLDFIFEKTRSLWIELRGGRIFITGGTGFIGCWLLESFTHAVNQLKLNAQAVVLTRDPSAFHRKAPHLASHPAILLQQGDIRNFDFPSGRFTHVIHAASESNPSVYTEHPLRMLDMILSGTRHVLDFALQCGTPKFLLVSSGTVYGRQPPELTHIPEDYPGEQDVLDPYSGFSEGKRLSELLCMTYGKQYGIQIKIARCFPFIGPYLPLDTHCTVSNFIRDGLLGGPIRLNGIKTSNHSYLYAADLAVWLWTILIRGECGHAYNVGSEQSISIASLARQIGQAFHPPIEVKLNDDVYPIDLGSADSQPENYVPSTQTAQTTLHLLQEIGLEEAVRRTVDWYCYKNPT